MEKQRDAARLACALERLGVFPKLASLFLQAAGDDHIPGFRGDMLEVEGHLVAMLTDAVGTDHIGQADDG